MTITTQKIPRQAWRSYFEELTKVLGTVEATVDVFGRDLGDQFVNQRQILTDITYDDRDDAIIVGLDAPDSEGERIEHLIERPQRVLVATGEPPPLEVTFDVEDGEQPVAHPPRAPARAACWIGVQPGARPAERRRQLTSARTAHCPDRRTAYLRANER